MNCPLPFLSPYPCDPSVDRRPLYSLRVDLTDAHRRVTDLLRRFPANDTAAPPP